MTRYFYDTEFLEDGKTIELISIGIVADDGRELYAVNEEVGKKPLVEKIGKHRWLMANVVPHLPLQPGTKPLMPDGSTLPGRFLLDQNSNVIMPRRMIRNAVREFLLAGTADIELWADYGAYDHVALCQLFGRMIDLPAGLPMYTNDFQQAWRAAGRPALPPEPKNAHDALADARHLKECFAALDLPEQPGVIHLVHDSSGITRCCFRPPYEIPTTDTTTTNADQVTCGMMMVGKGA